jgi:hypothetical protein
MLTPLEHRGASRRETIGAAGLMCSLQLRRERTVAMAHLADGALHNMHDAVSAGFRNSDSYAATTGPS